MKKCNTCKLMKPFEKFTINKYLKDRYHDSCKDCLRLKKEWNNKLKNIDK